MICSFFSIGNVNAYELTDFCDYTDPCLSTEMIDTSLINSNVNTEVYSNYFVYLGINEAQTYYAFYVVYYQDSKLSIIQSSDESYLLKFLGNYRNSAGGYSGNKINLSSFNKFYSQMSYSTVNLYYKTNSSKFIYYSNKDILDSDGNVVLPKREMTEPFPEEPEEDPNVVNNRVFLTKLTNFYKSLFSIISDIASTIITTPILVIPFGFCILAIIVGVFYKLFLRR